MSCICICLPFAKVPSRRCKLAQIEVAVLVRPARLTKGCFYSCRALCQTLQAHTAQLADAFCSVLTSDQSHMTGLVQPSGEQYLATFATAGRRCCAPLIWVHQPSVRLDPLQTFKQALPLKSLIRISSAIAAPLVARQRLARSSLQLLCACRLQRRHLFTYQELAQLERVSDAFCSLKSCRNSAIPKRQVSYHILLNKDRQL